MSKSNGSDDASVHMFHEIKAGDCTIHMDERFIPPKIRSLAASQILQHRSFLLFQHTGVVAGWSSKQFGTSTERVWVVLVVRFPGVGAGGVGNRTEDSSGNDPAQRPFPSESQSVHTPVHSLHTQLQVQDELGFTWSGSSG